MVRRDIPLALDSSRPVSPSRSPDGASSRNHYRRRMWFTIEANSKMDRSSNEVPPPGANTAACQPGASSGWRFEPSDIAACLEHAPNLSQLAFGEDRHSAIILVGGGNPAIPPELLDARHRDTKVLACPFDRYAPSCSRLDAKALRLDIHGSECTSRLRQVLVGYSRRDDDLVSAYKQDVPKKTRRPERILTNDEFWEIDCLQRQFPEHSREEILWALDTCRAAREDSALLKRCVSRRLKRKGS